MTTTATLSSAAEELRAQLDQFCAIAAERIHETKTAPLHERLWYGNMTLLNMLAGCTVLESNPFLLTQLEELRQGAPETIERYEAAKQSLHRAVFH